MLESPTLSLASHVWFFAVSCYLMALMIQPLASTMSALAIQPAATLTTLLYYSDLLPRNLNLERLVCHQLLRRGNLLFSFLVHFLACFW
ncbi:unnamed protein product [Coffea canephora]|uniref:Uncharacterized protein n=1 Tax=Coffea canephora TaxID=49390 RepID=A0A068TNY7_COFCA|nr:unnamed protein product [Coffea canephora]